MKQNVLFKKCCPFGLVFSLALQGAVAQESVAITNQTFTLQDLVSEAQKRNPELRVFEASIEAAQGGIATAKAYQNPEASFTPGVKHLPGDTLFKGTFGLSQLIEYPGKRALRQAIAERDVTASKLALDAFRYQVQLEVRRAFYDLLAAQEIESLRNEQVEAAKVFAESAKNRVESGYASDFETVKAEADLVRAQKLLREAQGRISAARAFLNTVTGRSAGEPLKVTGALDGATPVLPASNLIAFALANNPILGIRTTQIERAGLTLKSVRLSRKPDFTVGPVIEYASDEQIYGVGVSVPLPFWNKRKGEIQTAKAEQKRAVAELDKLKFDITKAVTVAAENLRTARDQLAINSPEFRNRLKTLVDQAEKSYARNATTLLIYLDARRTYFDAFADHAENLARIAEARAQLESAIGIPLNPSNVKP
ncbi:MAG: TolC family protein [Verrucomicrobiota bacterium]